MNDSAGRVSSIVSLVLRRSGIFFVLTFALLTQSVWGQRIEPLILDNQQRSRHRRAARATRPRLAAALIDRTSRLGGVGQFQHRLANDLAGAGVPFTRYPVTVRDDCIVNRTQ